ncbi:unnamed protein product [Wuchereria bancrofti]|uniref:Uncharacterized protein n=1 Tax=Wuchereria bancrofti TaxID=6293 RepID=A0A3P7FYW9_WUCBA|nr:unnamed protein product [Wuchereria bancrofti]
MMRKHGLLNHLIYHQHNQIAHKNLDELLNGYRVQQ